jgi:hypothetical protein
VGAHALCGYIFGFFYSGDFLETQQTWACDEKWPERFGTAWTLSKHSGNCHFKYLPSLFLLQCAVIFGMPYRTGLPGTSPEAFGSPPSSQLEFQSWLTRTPRRTTSTPPLPLFTCHSAPQPIEAWLTCACVDDQCFLHPRLHQTPRRAFVSHEIQGPRLPTSRSYLRIAAAVHFSLSKT